MGTFGYNFLMRKFLIAIALLLGVIYIITRFTEVQGIYETIQKGDWRFILLALIVEAAWIYNLGLAYQAVYRVFDLKVGSLHMMMLYTAGFFISVVTPSAGATAMAVYLSDARRMNFSSARVMIGWAMNVLFEFVALLCYVVLGLAVLARRNNLQWSEITASIILLIMALGLGTLLYLGLRSEKLLGNFLAFLARIINFCARPFIRRSFVDETRAHSFAHETAEGIDIIRHNPRSLLRPLVFSLINKTLLIIVFLLVFLAFKVPFSAGTIFAGFSIGQLFVIVSPTPGGIGIVEGIMTLTLTSLYVKVEAATILTLVYRAYTFWLPLLVGMVTIRHIQNSKPPKTNQSNLGEIE